MPKLAPHRVLRTKAPRLAVLLALVLVSELFLAGREGCGTKEQNETIKSPVQALGTVYKHSNGSVEAELVLISTIDKTHAFIDSATEVELVVNGQANPMTKDPSQHGRWFLRSEQLELEQGTRYLFRFDLDDPALAGEQSGGRFVAEVEGYDSPSTITPKQAAYRDHSLDVEISPAIRSPRRGLLRVYGPDGSLTFENFDLKQPQFDGSKHARLIVAGQHTIQGTAFPEDGEYRIVLYTMNYAAGFDPHLSAELGVFTGLLAGSAAEVSVTVE